jgi:glutathione synthase/RimK-type ligase-like ATP-grasp enzyme
MRKFSLAIAWNWEYDDDFVALIRAEAAELGLRTCVVTPRNLKATLSALSKDQLEVDVLFDRASDADDDFIPLVKNFERQGVHVFNVHEFVEHACDKATMHLELLSVGLNLPYTIIITPYNVEKEPALTLSSLEHLGRPFIIKPANTTGGGIGVVMGAESLKEVFHARQHNKDDKYLLQETIIPATIEGKRAWFRVIYAFGEVMLCWWDDRTHLYQVVTRDEEKRYGLGELRKIIETIRSVCKLDFFSSEIALTAPCEIAITAEGKYVVIDYVNEICDMRLQSRHVDGVPDAIVERIAQLIASTAAAKSAERNPVQQSKEHLVKLKALKQEPGPKRRTNLSAKAG